MTPQVLTGVRGRSGITLTEILISILIMGVGVISLATLFPLGLIRLRNAQRMTRGAFLLESAVADLGARNLLYKQSFTDPTHSPWFQRVASPGTNYDPWLVDTPAYGSDWQSTPWGAGAYQDASGTIRAIEVGVGLPVAYDPLWRYVTKSYPSYLGASGTFEGRFGSGIGLLRNDPGGGNPSAHGLQRLSNLQATFDNSISPQFVPAAWQTNAAQFQAKINQNGATVTATFVSPEDYVLQDRSGTYQDPNSALGVSLVTPSPVVPDMSAGSPTQDWRFTWLFTGRQADRYDGTVFDGDVVICENRPFGIDSTGQISGETVVEAIWGFSSTPDTSASGAAIGLAASVGYATPSARRTVVLRWPSSQVDPDVRVGGWIADVTYERTAVASLSRFPYVYPAQRCYWYQVSKKSDPVADTLAGYRRMTVWVASPLRARSLLDFSTTPATPVHVEAALVMPSVVNVYPKTIYTR